MADDIAISKLNLLLKEVEFLREASVLFAKRQVQFHDDLVKLRSDVLQILHRLDA